MQEAEKELFSVFVTPDDVTKELVSLLPLAKDTKALLAGPPGSGKSTLIQGICSVYFGPDSVGKVQADPSLTPDDVLYRLDLAKLVKGEGEVAYPREIVTRPLKWFNEVTRANTVLQDAFLGLLAEKEVRYRDSVFKSPDFVALADFNPADMGGAQNLSWPVSDRFDVLIEIGALSLLQRVQLTLEKYQGQHLKDLRVAFKSVLTFEQVKQVWADVERVTVPQSVSVLAEMLMEEITGCLYDRNRQSALYREKCAKGSCEFFSEICSKIERPASYRATDALISLGKARAWRDRRAEVSLDDLLFLFPAVLAHRTTVKGQFLVAHNGSPAQFFRAQVEETYESKKKVWKEAVVCYGRAIGEIDEDALGKLRGLSSRDLAVKSLYANVEKAVRGIVDQILTRAETEKYTTDDLAKAEGYVKLVADEFQKLYADKLEELRERLVIKASKAEYLEKLLPVVATIEPKLAAKVATGRYEGKTFSVSIGSDNATIEARDSTTAGKLRAALR